MALVKSASEKSGKSVKSVAAVRMGDKGNLIVRITKGNTERARGITMSNEDFRELLGNEFKAELNKVKAGGTSEFVKKTEKGFSVKVTSAAVAISLTAEGWDEFFSLENEIVGLMA